LRSALKDIPSVGEIVGSSYLDPFAEIELDPEVDGWES
jgi:hypothetical protein